MKDKRVLVVELARNFGHQVSITAGLDFARGQAVAVMDADLQDPPEALPEFIAKWRKGYDVIYAIREQRKERWLKQSRFRSLLSHPPPCGKSGSSVGLRRFLRRWTIRVVELLKSMPERSRFIRGIRSSVAGFNQVGLPFERHAQYAGQSKYTIRRSLLLALDGLISFSYVPLRFISFLGLRVSGLSIFLAVFYFVKKLLYGLSPPGFATLVVSIFFLAGIQLITMGVIGEYVAGIFFEEAKRRPLYVLRRATRNS